MTLPVIAVTMGDPAGIGPEVTVRALSDAALYAAATPVVIGHPAVLERAARLIGARLIIDTVKSSDSLRECVADRRPDRGRLLCWNPSDAPADAVPPATIDIRAGRAARDYVVHAARAALSGSVDAVATAPLNKAALRLADARFPGHTELLAHECRAERVAMTLHLPADPDKGRTKSLSVVHVTLHMALADVFSRLSTAVVLERIELVHDFTRALGVSRPVIAVCALNPHAGEQGLFGNEEAVHIRPAVEQARSRGWSVVGPLPADTLFPEAARGRFDAVVAMYHDQGHIALKLLGGPRCVNVTLGLPIVRTSPSHGTAFDIAWQGRADARGMLEALMLAARLASRTDSQVGPTAVEHDTISPRPV